MNGIEIVFVDTWMRRTYYLLEKHKIFEASAISEFTLTESSLASKQDFLINIKRFTAEHSVQNELNLYGSFSTHFARCKLRLST